MSEDPTPHRSFIDRLFEPVDNASAVFLRMAFGMVILWEATRYFIHGWILRYYCAPEFHFKYYGFGWVEPMSPFGMKALFVVIGLSGLMIAFGLFYRAAIAVFFVSFTYVFLLEQARYLNHFYFVVLMGLIMIPLPLHRAASLDVCRKPALRSTTMPRWCLWLLQFQIGVVYFYGGVAKLNADWLAGQPMGLWLGARTDFPVIGAAFEQPWMVYAFSYGGLLFDLGIVFALMWRRSRIAAYVVCLTFHLLNARLFSIGIFPWMMIAISTIYFAPDWPRRLGRRLFSGEAEEPGAAEVAERPKRWRLIVGALAVYAAVQLLVPLRHWLYPGPVNWTEEGHMFSWHMKLRDKRARTRFYLIREGHPPHRIPVHHFLPRFQRKKMYKRPDMMLQYAAHLKRRYREAGLIDFEIRVDARVGLNGRPQQAMIDPEVNLLELERSLAPKPWILPLETKHAPPPGS